MTKIVDIEKVQKSLDNVAYNAKRGSDRARSGRFDDESSQSGRFFDSELKRMLASNGCQHVRDATGQHEIWFSPTTKRHFVIPARIRSRHTANAILVQAGLSKVF